MRNPRKPESRSEKLLSQENRFGRGENLLLNRNVAIGFAVAGAVSCFWPGFNGKLFEPSSITVAESRIIAAIFRVGAAVAWFLRDLQ